MQYLILLHAEEGAWAPEEYPVALQESVGVCHDLHRKGQFRAASPVKPSDHTTQVRVREGQTVVFDGPFAETKEQLGGFFLIDVDSLNEAIAIAARLPGARRGTAEIRPLVEVPGVPVYVPNQSELTS